MDREYIAKHNLTEAHKQFMRLAEGYISTSLAEANDDEAPAEGGAPDPNTQPPMDGNQPPMGPDANGGAPDPTMGDDPNGMPPADPNQPAPADGQPPMDGQDPNAQPPMDAPMPEGPMGDNSEPQEKDQVIDVEDITNAQEKLNKKENMVGQDLGKLDSRIETLMTSIEKMNQMIDKENSEITNLKAELQRRVPTQTERLDMRSLDSYPFNVNPTDYWKNKEAEGGYAARYDNNQPEGKKEYSITNKDIDNYTDSDIEKSLDDDYDQTMEKIFKGFA